jgi:hypothetical protein
MTDYDNYLYTMQLEFDRAVVRHILAIEQYSGLTNNVDYIKAAGHIPVVPLTFEEFNYQYSNPLQAALKRK